MTDKTTAPEWLCHACTRPVAADAGYVWCDYARAIRRHTARLRHDHDSMAQSFPEPDDMGRLSGVPEPIRWHVHHKDCDPDPEGAAYSIEIERIDTWPKVAGWCAHLIRKQWLIETDWSVILRRIGGQG